MSYSAGLKIAREKLRAYALAGAQEAAIIIDRATGEHLDFQVGGTDEVTPEWHKIPAGAQVTVLHVHHTDTGPGPEDWDVVALHPQIKGSEIVCPNLIFIVEKPDNWRHPLSTTWAAAASQSSQKTKLCTTRPR